MVIKFQEESALIESPCNMNVKNTPLWKEMKINE